MTLCVFESLSRNDAFVGDAANDTWFALMTMLLAWHHGKVYVPSGLPVEHMDQTLVEKLGDRPGLILFSSGSTGEPKAALHNAEKLMAKFRGIEAPPKRMLFFMALDHIGGINTALHSLATGGTLVTVKDRKPETVCAAIEKHRVQVLPTTPTFLNMLLMSGAWRDKDLSSLELITYGTEPMPAATLEAATKAFPGVRFKQTYGLSELGILQTKSKADDSLWMKVGGPGFETRVVDGLLEIKADSAMLGYLNAASPFTDDGWFRTGDAVEIDGEWMRVLGRRSEIINVGGEKVYPAEVESLLMEIPGIEAAVVSGEPNCLMGQLVKCKVKVSTGETANEVRKRIRGAWRHDPYKMPLKVELADGDMVTERFKRERACSSS